MFAVDFVALRAFESHEFCGVSPTCQCLNASLLRTKSSDGHFCVGSAISFVDFLVLNLALVLEFTLGADKAQSLLSAVAPVVATASTATRERPGVSAYLSDCGEPVLFPLCQVGFTHTMTCLMNGMFLIFPRSFRHSRFMAHTQAPE